MINEPKKWKGFEEFLTGCEIERLDQLEYKQENSKDFQTLSENDNQILD